MNFFQMTKQKTLLFVALLAFSLAAVAQKRIIPGAERMEQYLPFLKGKNVAIFANPTSMVGNVHLVDTLLKRGIKIIKIFGPEHGFRGKADAGEKVGNTIDKETGIEVISLYGNHHKPSPEDLKNACQNGCFLVTLLISVISSISLFLKCTNCTELLAQRSKSR